MPKLTIDGFIDEAAHDRASQVRIIEENGLGGISLRSGNMTGKRDANFMAWQPDEDAAFCDAMSKSGFRVNCVGSPLLKCLPQSWPNEASMWPSGEKKPEKSLADVLEKDVPRIVRMCELTNCNLVRTFTTFLPRDKPIGEAFADRRSQIIDWVGQAARKLKAHGIASLIEVEGNQGGYNGRTVFDIYDAVKDEGNVGIIWDPANVRLQYGSRAETVEQYLIAKPGIRWVHAKFSIAIGPQTNGLGFVNEGKNVLAGKFTVLGDHDDSGGRDVLADQLATADENAAWLSKFGWTGGMPFTLEPHLAEPAEFGGFSGEDNFVRAHDALRREALAAGYELIG